MRIISYKFDIVTGFALAKSTEEKKKNEHEMFGSIRLAFGKEIKNDIGLGIHNNVNTMDIIRKILFL